MFLQCGFGVWRNSALSKCSRCIHSTCRRFLLPAGAYNCIFEEKFPKMSLKKSHIVVAVQRLVGQKIATECDVVSEMVFVLKLVRR